MVNSFAAVFLTPAIKSRGAVNLSAGSKVYQVTMRLLALVGLFALVASAAAVKFQFVEEWNMWKTEHGKSYGSEMEELERHLNWLSSKAYIEAHNANTHIFGFTLKMNHLGDLVM